MDQHHHKQRFGIKAFAMLIVHLFVLILVFRVVVLSPIKDNSTKRRSISRHYNHTNTFNIRRRDYHDTERPDPVVTSYSASKKGSAITRLPRDPFFNTKAKARSAATTSETTTTTITTTSHPVLMENNFTTPQTASRRTILLPDLDSKGRPQCLQNPTDTFCEAVETYPKTVLKHDIEYTPVQFLELFGNTIEGRKSYAEDDNTEERVCKRVPKVIYPKMAKNQENQWVYVVNEVEYTQAVVAEVCEKEGRACAYLDSNLPPGMYSRCKQKYSYKRLLALHPTEKRTYPDTFKFPSCCACYVKSPPSLSRSLN